MSANAGAGGGATSASAPPPDLAGDPLAVLAQQLAPDPDQEPLDYQKQNLWAEVYRLGQWFPGDATSERRWVSTTGTTEAWYDTMAQSLLNNILVLPLIVLALLGVLLTLQRLHKLSEALERTQRSLDAVREQMAIPERR
ncbi:hypothetical protein [Engelhardtia mirabilis]|uniref:Uncharacterized protein n=1 Tax=Engelhardtia mirabilis TaxID=2528011 RepID=A0A518BPP2_9BACT|nr:hypothetical protein Pla133_40410 [Planctomycetes bacterium Pla133]QDV03253.1 hypothetical protein Pla86_40400 [Planctomycetes bacterium Pla86]